ncbi:hypothetical protein LSAT2_003103 [Lamellibrachia satsuma]|nr:hypothetical protein LSAT2_003103 [Lamellibrachia satsuma]
MIMRVMASSMVSMQYVNVFTTLGVMFTGGGGGSGDSSERVGDRGASVPCLIRCTPVPSGTNSDRSVNGTRRRRSVPLRVKRWCRSHRLNRTTRGLNAGVASDDYCSLPG